jgi:hypothetical protein
MQSGPRNSIIVWHLALPILLLCLVIMQGYSTADTDTKTGSSSLKSATGDDLPTDLRGRLFLALKTEVKEAYINEMIPVTVTLYSDRVLVRDLQYPKLYHKDFGREDFGNPIWETETKDGGPHDMVEFKTFFFGTKPGDFILGPAELGCRIFIQSPGDVFFGPSEEVAVTLRSEQIRLRVVPLPQEDKPHDFNGAVGDFDLSVNVQPREINVGDSVSMRTRISGSGNIESIRCPAATAKEGLEALEPTSNMRDGVKTCEQVFTVLEENIKEMPEITFSFFDPVKKKYRTFKEGPFAIRVAINETARTMLGGNYSEVEAKKIRAVNDLHSNIQRSAVIVAIVSAAVLFVVAMQRKKLGTLIDEYRKRVKRERNARASIREAEKFIDSGESVLFYSAIFRTLQEYLGDMFSLSQGSVTGDIIDNVLKLRAIDDETLIKLRSVFQDCDKARFGYVSFDRDEMKQTINSVLIIISRLGGKFGNKFKVGVFYL